jgi:type IV secretion system protein TrbI
VNEREPEAKRDIAAELRLRPERPMVARLSRRVLMALAGAGAIVISGAMMWALHQRQGSATSGRELYNIENTPTADGLSKLPRDYTGIPRNIPPLGPPLPGDLGRPMLNAHQGSAIGSAPVVDPSEQRFAQEEEAARTSRIFATTNAVERPAPPVASPAAEHGASVLKSDGPTIDPDAPQNMQDRKLAFLTAPVDRKTVSADRLSNPASRYVVQAGFVIPAALITGIRSDLPGQVTAQVTENVYDSPSGNYLLIPQGAKLVGTYDSQVSFGQDRVLLVWTRLIMPNGRSIVLERQPDADVQGFAGLEDQVDYHWGQLFIGAALSTLLGVGSELGASNNDNAIVQALRQGGSNSLSQTGQLIVRRNLNIQPTITVRPGFPVRVIVNRDLVLAPYQS